MPRSQCPLDDFRRLSDVEATGRLRNPAQCDVGEPGVVCQAVVIQVGYPDDLHRASWDDETFPMPGGFTLRPRRTRRFMVSHPDPLAAAEAALSGRTIAVLTGAGISTDSGIPGYRGEGSTPRSPM